MTRLFLIISITSISILAQSNGTDPLDIIGFEPFSQEESQTMWDEASLLLGSQTECIKRQRIKQDISSRDKSSGGSIFSRNGHKNRSSGGTANIGEDCTGGVMGANQAIHRAPVTNFMKSFAKQSYGLDSTGNNSNSNSYRVASWSGKGGSNISGLENMSCYFQAPDSRIDRETKNKFLNSHFNWILSHKGLSNKSLKSSVLKMEKFGNKIYKDDRSGVSRNSAVEYSKANIVIYSKKLNSIAEALPYVVFSNQKRKLASQDLKQSSLGSSDLGADQLSNQIAIPPYYAGNRGKNVVFGNSPIKRFQGSNEGINGSKAIVAWHLCIDKTKNKSKDSKKTPSKNSKPELNSGVDFGADSVGVYMPNNIISPFPLVVENGKINEKETQIDYSLNPDGSVKINFDKPQFHYGPRNTPLTKEEKKQMQDAASTMRLSVKSFIDKSFSRPGTKLNTSNSAFNIQSCSNKLNNQKGYKNWDTQGKLEKHSSGGRISFSKLSNLRSQAQALMAKKILKKEIDKDLEKIELEIKKYKATVMILPNRDVNKSRLENKVAYLESKKQNMQTTDFSKVKINIVPCGKNGSNGPDPYFASLKRKFAPKMKFPNAKKLSKSAYFTSLANLSKKLKKKDVEEKYNLAKKALAKGSLNPVQVKQYKESIKTYDKILKRQDGQPGYLDTPVLNVNFKNYNNKFPCDMNYPDKNINCDIIKKNNIQLNNFKVESISLDVDIKNTKPSPDVLLGYENSSDKIVEPGEGEMFYAAIMGTRKVKQVKRRKGKKCRSSATGSVIPCSTKSSRSIRK